jgi:hypothetical protein
MANRTSDVIPAAVSHLAEDLEVPSADWYVASAESGRGAGALAELWNFDIPEPGVIEDSHDEDQAAAPELQDAE